MTPVDPNAPWPTAASDPRRPTLAPAPRCAGHPPSVAGGALPGSPIRLSAGFAASAALRRAVEMAPEVRQERVAALRAAIGAGRYAVEPDKIAARMVVGVF